MIVFGMGLAAFFAALQVYFRDTSSFLPFFVRIWMYLSPILWAPEHVIGRFSGPIMTLIQLNPMYSMIGGYTELLQNDSFPHSVHVDLCGGVGARGCGDRLLVLHLEGA